MVSRRFSLTPVLARLMSDPLFRVADQVVLVSGGTRGIGRALAMGFAVRGAQVVITGRTSAGVGDAVMSMNAELADTAATVATSPIVGVACDASKPAEVTRAVSDILTTKGRIDTLLNVAGVNIRQPALKFTEDELDYVLDTNLKGVFLMAQAVGRHMVERRSGAVINIDSLNSVGPLKNVAPYAMSKCGVNGLTRVLAIEWGPSGVRVNGLAPGFILTDLTQKLWSDPTMKEWGRTNTPLGRMGRPEDLVGTALYLASPAAAFLTGQTIYVDGGFVAGRNWPIPADGGHGR
jgi:gluconate 5-dehydrogenase